MCVVTERVQWPHLLLVLVLRRLSGRCLGLRRALVAVWEAEGSIGSLHRARVYWSGGIKGWSRVLTRTHRTDCVLQASVGRCQHSCEKKRKIKLNFKRK